MAESSNAPPAVDIPAQIAILTAQAQENSNQLMALEKENTTLRRENCTLQEHLSTVEVTPQQPRDPRFRVQVLPMPPLYTLDKGVRQANPQCIRQLLPARL